MKKLLKILLKIVGALLLLGLLAFGIGYAIYNQPLPEGTAGPEADALAQRMLKAINYEQYQRTKYLEWSFASGTHQYKWDKENGKVDVKWDGHTVALNLNDIALSIVDQENLGHSGKKSRDLYNTAWKYFNNDSFWLVAPFKVFDEGTTRSIVTLEDGSQELLISYITGGSTPGDSYLWKLGVNGFPISYKMWVEIIPIGGLEASWDDWKVMENGLFLPASHQLGPLTLDMGEPRAYN